MFNIFQSPISICFSKRKLFLLHKIFFKNKTTVVVIYHVHFIYFTNGTYIDTYFDWNCSPRTWKHTLLPESTAIIKKSFILNMCLFTITLSLCKYQAYDICKNRYYGVCKINYKLPVEFFTFTFVNGGSL